MSGVNASFAKLLEYEQRASGEASANASQGAQGDWAGLTFRLGGNRLVCSVERIHESLPLPQVTRVPGTKPFILGLANVRGDLLAVVDFGCFLSGRRSPVSMRSRLLSASLRGRPVGLLVDEVFGQKNFMGGEATSPELGSDSELEGLVNRRHRSGNDEWHELDLDALFSRPDFLDGAAA